MWSSSTSFSPLQLLQASSYSLVTNTTLTHRLQGKKLQQRLEEAPEGLQEMAVACPFLTFVDLSDAGASLTALPTNFSQLLQLHELKCVRNGLRALPEGLGGLPLLRTIILEGNLLSQLPADLFKLPRLHTLNASHNQLTALPDQELLAAAELHYLDVRWGCESGGAQDIGGGWAGG